MEPLHTHTQESGVSTLGLEHLQRLGWHRAVKVGGAQFATGETNPQVEVRHRSGAMESSVSSS